MFIERCEIIQRVLDLFVSPRYLEIGVDQGVTFHQLQATSKVGVDPRFAFDVSAAKADPVNASARYMEMTSDAYFTQHGGAVEPIDVAFIDGLHSFDQTLRDLLHASYALAPGGILIIDDVMPSTYQASLPDLDESRRLWAASNWPDGSWMGDVYRLVFFIKDYLTSFTYASVLENHGQTILWKAPRVAEDTPRNVEAIARLDYARVVLERDTFKFQSFAEIEQTLKAYRNNF